MRPSRALAYALAAGLLTALATAGAAAASPETDATISLVERDGSSVNILVSVPADADVDLAAVSVAVDGVETTSSAELAEAAGDVRRVSVLAIDTSNSMKGPRFEAAKAAANTYLDAVPSDVFVGIVTFDSDVEVSLPPTIDRDEARAVIAGLGLKRQTLLYDGVLEAVRQTGVEGGRTVLVLSDGADTSGTTLDDVTAAIAESEPIVDVVSLDLEADEVGALPAIAAAGRGEVIEATPEALRATFTRQAEALADQILIRAEVPASVTAREATVEVTLPAGPTTLTAEAFAVVNGPTGPPPPEIRAPARGFTLPDWAMYAAVGMVGVGLLLLLVLLVPAKQAPLTAVEVVDRYTSSGKGTRAGKNPNEREGLAQASQGMAEMLQRNKGLENKIAGRLEAAGSSLRPPEWLLVHTAIIVAAGFLGILIGRGNLVIGIVFIALGVLVPWLYLGFKKSRRFKAFNSALPDTLQLMSGSLQAGLSLAQSCDTIVKEGHEPIAGEFKRVLIETRLGVDLVDALDGVTERFQSKDFGWVVMAIKIQRDVGGNLAELLNTVAGTMREREYMRRQVAALAAEGKLSAYVLGGLPPAFMVYLLLIRRDYVMPLFTEPLGLLMLGGAGTLLTVGAFWMSRLIKVEV